MSIKRYLPHISPFLVAFAVLFIGAADIDWKIAFDGIVNYVLHGSELESDAAIVWDIRLPRIILAVLVGAILSGSGAAMQTIFKNPLVDPFLLGISSGAALGCALSVAVFPSLPIQPLAFVGALVATLGALGLAKIAGGGRIALVLAGVVLSAFLGAATGVIKFFASPDKVQAIVIWLMGSLSLSDWGSVKIALVGFVVGFVPLFAIRWRINILSLGDDEAKSIGVSLEKVRFFAVLCAAFACALAVSVSGTIGWIGLLTPHIARILVGSDMRRLLPASISLGAALMLISDTIARTLTQYDLPVGMVTAMLGAPFFVLLLRRANSGWTQG